MAESQPVQQFGAAAAAPVSVSDKSMQPPAKKRPAASQWQSPTNPPTNTPTNPPINPLPNPLPNPISEDQQRVLYYEDKRYLNITCVALKDPFSMMTTLIVKGMYIRTVEPLAGGSVPSGSSATQEAFRILGVTHCLVSSCDGCFLVRARAFLNADTLRAKYPQLKDAVNAEASIIETEEECLVNVSDIQETVEVYFDAESFHRWQRMARSLRRHLCVQELRFEAGEPRLAPITITKKRAAESQVFGRPPVNAFPSDKGYLDVENLKDFYRAIIMGKLFHRIKDGRWINFGARFAVHMPESMFAALIRPLGHCEKETSHILVTAFDYDVLRKRLLPNWADLLDPLQKRGRKGLPFPFKDMEPDGTTNASHPLKSRGRVVRAIEFRFVF